jgi:hypothetical protein
VNTKERGAVKHVVNKSLAKTLLATIFRLTLLFAVVAILLGRIPQEDRALESYGVVVAFVILSVVYAFYFFFQLREIRRSQHPQVRATEAMISTAFLFLAMFATIYTIISVDDPSSFTEPLTSFTGLYLAITVLSTVGFGDITPVSVMARSVIMVQMALGLVYLGLVVKVFAGAVKSRKKTG